MRYHICAAIVAATLAIGAADALAGTATKVAAGGEHTCALTAVGGVVCWGYNGSGQLGDGTTTQRRTPTPVSGLASGVTAVAAGSSHYCALTAAGGGVCWGWDGYGQLGLGMRRTSTQPIAVYGHGGAIAVDSMAPAHGPTGGGTVVTVTGAYFLQGATVTIGGVAATNVIGVNTETIVATSGAHPAGTAAVVVTNPDGTQATLAAAFRYGSRAPGADFTGDVKSDLLWRHAALGEVWLWPMAGAAKTAETHVRTVGDMNWEVRSLGDQDGDGKADILWRNKTTGQLYFWPMDGSTPIAETYVTTVDPAYDIVGSGDFDGDGKSDILWRHTTLGDIWIWLMNGATPLSQTYVDTVDLAYVVKGVADLDADGKADIVFHHQTLGEVWVWPMNGTARLSQDWVGTVPDTGYQIVGVADHTGDGTADLLWHHATLGEVWIWTMNGPVRMAETWVGTVPDTGYRIVGNGDYNGDAKADILWHHATLGEVWVWLMDGTTKVSETWVGTVRDDREA